MVLYSFNISIFYLATIDTDDNQYIYCLATFVLYLCYKTNISYDLHLLWW